MGGIYLWWTTINVLAFAWSLKKLRVLLPNWSTLAHIPIAFCMIVFLDAILEIPATSFGLVAYPCAPYSLTLWAGTSYQLDRKSVVSGTCVSVSVDLVGPRI